jgi:hypothetical protein
MRSSAIARLFRWRYREDVGIGRQPGQEQVPPAQRPQDLADYAGHWVALLRGNVIASADNDRELAQKLKNLGPDGENAVMQYVRPPVSGYVVGVG